MVMLVEECARTADVVARLQETVDNADTLRTRGSRGQDVAIPELDALRQYRAQFAALVKQLDLPAPVDDDEDGYDTGNVVPLTPISGRRAGCPGTLGAPPWLLEVRHVATTAATANTNPNPSRRHRR